MSCFVFLRVSYINQFLRFLCNISLFPPFTICTVVDFVWCSVARNQCKQQRHSALLKARSDCAFRKLQSAKIEHVFNCTDCWVLCTVVRTLAYALRIDICLQVSATLCDTVMYCAFSCGHIRCGHAQYTVPRAV